MLQLWLELARTFLALQQTGDARYCVQQAKSRAPGSPATHHMEGRVCQVTPNHCLHHHLHFHYHFTYHDHHHCHHDQYTQWGDLMVCLGQVRLPLPLTVNHNHSHHYNDNHNHQHHQYTQ